jgi:uncharacterized membrane protein YsdA (DUF1294 family)/cold shock CspA family protein
MEGFVVKFDEKRGFGFIRSNELSEDVFVHIQDIPNQQSLSVGQQVRFETRQSDRGLVAVEIVPGKKRTSPYYLYGITALILTILATVLLFSWADFHIIVAYLLSVNLSTFLFYGYDKTIAGSSLLRVPEWVLHSLSLAGGSPAGLLAQKVFRHKTIKGSFQFVYWSIVVVQVVIIGLVIYYF